MKYNIIPLSRVKPPPAGKTVHWQSPAPPLAQIRLLQPESAVLLPIPQLRPAVASAQAGSQPVNP
jgi:hypothetical protein